MLSSSYSPHPLFIYPFIPTLFVSSLSSGPPSSPSFPISPSPSATPKCIYEHEHLLASPDGPLPVDRVFDDLPPPLQPQCPHLIALVISMFVVLVLVLLVLLVLLAYFGREVIAGNKRKSETPIQNGLQSSNSNIQDTENRDPKEPKAENSEFEDPQDPEITKSIEEPEQLLMVSNVQNLKIGKEFNAKVSIPELNLHIHYEPETATFEKTPQSSPISTSSCISSEILTDSCLMEEENEDEEIQPSPKEEIMTMREAPSSLLLRPSSLPVHFSTSSNSSTSSAPYFNFTRKTPDIEMPRLMLEEFEALDRSIEKRKIDIRDLLKRIESAKRRHRRFSEHIQQVQREHNIRF